jgi:hypothetical protein
MTTRAMWKRHGLKRPPYAVRLGIPEFCVQVLGLLRHLDAADYSERKRMVFAQAVNGAVRTHPTKSRGA